MFLLWQPVGLVLPMQVRPNVGLPRWECGVDTPLKVFESSSVEQDVDGGVCSYRRVGRYKCALGNQAPNNRI